MRLLLDTHIAIWAMADSPHLPERARALIATPSNIIFVSVASLWELAIKRAKGRTDIPPYSSADAASFFKRAGYRILDVTEAHAVAVETLPLHHGDPFDRLLVAQARTEPLVLLTHDAAMARYGDRVMRV